MARDRVPPDRLGLRSRASRIAAVYALFATLWIYFSDHALALLLPNPALMVQWSMYKGLGFVGITSLLLLLLMRQAWGAAESGYLSLAAKERELRASKEQLASIIGTAMDAIITLDDSRRIVLFNTAAERMFGCESGEALDMPVSSFIPGELDPLKCAVSIVQGLRRDGRSFPAEVSVSRIQAGDESLLTVILRDVSERETHAAEIERFKRLYAALSQVNQAIVWMPTRTDLFQKVCRVLVEHGGFRMAWIAWKVPQTQVFAPMADWGDELGFMQSIQAHSHTWPGGLRPGGMGFSEAGDAYVCNNIAVESAAPPWRDEALSRGLRSLAVFPIRLKNRVDGVLTVHAAEAGFFQDREMALLTEAAANLSFGLENLAREEERRRAEEIAGRERLFSETMIESMPGILYFFDEQGRFLRWNRNFEVISGRSADEISRMHQRDFVPAAAVPSLEHSIAEGFALGESSLEAPFLAKDGTSTPFFFTGRRIRFDGQACLVGIGIDISERKRAEVELRELNETLELKVAERTGELQAALVRAESADRIKSAFLATMSHELRTPLNSIIGFTGIVLQGLAGPLNEEQARQLGMVRSSSRHLLELINDVLDISKIEAGQLEVRAESFDLKASVERVMELVKPLADKKGLVLASTISPELRPLVSDRRRVEQILLNLLNNAIKFTDFGGVSMHVETLSNWKSTPDAEEVPAVCFRVVDTGIGISQEDLASLFQPFRQIDHGLARQHEGTGLGLAICRRLASLLGGSISATSGGSGGSEFVVELPLHKPATSS